MSAIDEFNAGQQALTARDFARAERLFRGLTQSLPLRANHALGVTLAAQGRYKAAEAAYQAALAAGPDDPRTLYGLSLLRLGEGNYAEGWSLWEHRRDVPGMLRDPPKVDAPEWRGEDLAGKRLLVAGEQGLGDEIMWARFIPELKARGAEVVFTAKPALRPIFGNLGVALAEERRLERGGFDAWTFVTSLSGLLGARLESLPPPTRLSVPAARGGGGVGVVPQGSPTHRNDACRSLFGRDAQRLLALGRDLRPEATGAKDFAETAAIIAGLDLVITVDTAIAHLAGSMGAPVWILVPAVEPDWRWLREGEASPWYPSARLFRQRKAGDWQPVFRRLEGALAEAGLR